MAKSSVQALINPALVVWAREALGLSSSEAAKRLKVPEARLETWERGEERPSLPQLRRVAALYRRPLAFFYLPQPPASKPTSPPDFRRREAAEAKSGPGLALEMRRARERRQIVLELAAELDEPIPTFDLTTDAGRPVGEIADAIRDWLGISLQDQFKWPDP